MSYVSTYAKKPPNFKGISMTVGVHVLVVAGIFAIPGIELPELPPNVVDTYNVPEPKPVDPAPEPQKPIEDIPQAAPAPTDIRPLVERPVSVDPVNPGYSSLGEDLLSGEGLIDRLPPIEPVPLIPDPVIEPAKMNKRYSSSFQPRYPSGQLRLGTEALISVRVLVGTDGRVKQIELIDTPHADFWTATRKHALKKWRFNPATRDGKPFESWMALKVRFQITD